MPTSLPMLESLTTKENLTRLQNARRATCIVGLDQQLSERTTCFHVPQHNVDIIRTPPLLEELRFSRVSAERKHNGIRIQAEQKCTQGTTCGTAQRKILKTMRRRPHLLNKIFDSRCKFSQVLAHELLLRKTRRAFTRPRSSSHSLHNRKRRKTWY